jgi:succinoglycan biosynthesis transport protein ExoP
VSAESPDLEPGGLPAFLKEPAGLVRRRWPWMLGVLLLGVAVTVGVVLSMPVTYLARATILMTSQQIPQDFVRTTVPDEPYQRINALVGEILSRERLAAMIETHGLYPQLRAQAPLSEVISTMRANVDIGPDAGVGRRTRNDGSSIFAVQFRHEDPQVAATVTNEIASLFTAASARMRGQQARLTTQFLRAELERTERELRDQDRRVTEFKERYRGELPGELNTNLNKLERLGSQRHSLNAQIAEAETRLAMLTEGGADAQPSSPAARLSGLRARLAEQLAVHTDEHPNVISLQRQIEELEARMASGEITMSQDPQRAILIDSTRRSIEDMRAMLQQVNAELDDRDVAVARTAQREEELKALEDDAQVLRDNYLQFLRKVQAAELAENLESAQQGERVAVLDRALPPTQPEKRRLKYMVAGLLASLLAALGLGVGLELWDPVVVSGEQIQSDFGLPVLGSVPRIA